MRQIVATLRLMKALSTIDVMKAKIEANIDAIEALEGKD